MSTTLVLIGPHGAGKSTIARELSRELGWAFHPEIGHQLRLEALAADSGAIASLAQLVFDKRVIEEELRRDEAWDSRVPRIVETWHMGNLAYARLRSPEVASAFEESCRRAVDGTVGVIVLPVTARAEVLERRLSEPGKPEAMLAFFAAVSREAGRIASEWGMDCLGRLDTSEEGLEAVIGRVVRGLAARSAPWRG